MLESIFPDELESELRLTTSNPGRACPASTDREDWVKGPAAGSLVYS